MVNALFTCLEYLVVLFTIIGTNTPYAFAIERDYHLPDVLAVILVVLVVLRLHRVKAPRRIVKSIIELLGVYYVIVVLVMIFSVHTPNTVSFIGRFVIELPLYILLFVLYIIQGEQLRIIDKYINIMVAISVISLFFWMFISSFKLVPVKPTSYIKAMWGIAYNYPSYFGVYFERQNQRFFSFYNGPRNQGIFCEAPMFSLCLVFAIAFQLFLKNQRSPRVTLPPMLDKYKEKQRDRIKTIILVVALCTTITTTGFLMLIFVLLGNYMITMPKHKIMRKFKWVLFLFILIFGFVVAVIIFRDKADSLSWSTHLEDFRIGIKAWLSNVLFGQGYGENDAMYSQFSQSRITMYGMSNSVTVILAQGGLFLFSIYCIPMIQSAIHCFNHKYYGYLLFVAVFLMEFVVTIFPYTPVMFFVLACLYANMITKVYQT